MECTLMHKNIPIMDIEIYSETGRIVKYGPPLNYEHLPVGTVKAGAISHKAIDDWWTGRSIPASREGIEAALRNMGMESTAFLVAKCYGLSLSDQYWFAPKGMGLKWEDVNFFQNDFSKDVGEILFGREPKNNEHISLLSPDNTSDGWLMKKWIIADGKRLLMKGGSRPYYQEPFNEIVASAIMRRLNVAHVGYTLTFEKGKPYSLCENFITTDTELVPAWRVFEYQKKSNNDSVLTHLLRCADELEIPGVRETIDRMLTVDYIIANEDRHFNNFGFFRDVNTLKWKGSAPIFDSGTSLWYNALTRHVGSEMGSKPFKNKHDEQIKLVSDLSWFDYGALRDIKDECAELMERLEETPNGHNEKIASAVAERCEAIARMREQTCAGVTAKAGRGKGLQDRES
jgi:hypothetical protein